MTRIAIVGMACRYPDAVSPSELWDNAVAGRRAFRRLPDERMRLADYWDADPAAPDRFYSRNAAVIEGYEFDRIGYKIAGSTYRSTDLTHWLALDTAALALADAGFPMGDGLPLERTGVVVGNTLTGEFTRANGMRLRWPYVSHRVAAALKDQGWEDDQLAPFLDDLEAAYKSPFPAINEDSLAGALSNTIAGRICNYFNLNGGGYTVDGACSSSLLSVVTGCKSLLEGDIDVAIAGGVDLSIDPFEIVGFAKTGALATGEMKVYDRDSNGFWPGEGCGMVVLMREADAKEGEHRIYATVAGWGISSDGKGGITRPEIGGYQLAMSRAYARAGFGIETVGLFEGHGTGTEVGDATELKALSQARLAADPAGAPAALTTIKGMIGHTKAAAGVAGLIKAVLAVHEQVLPPTTGCVDPHPVLTEEPTGLRVLRQAEPWPAGVPVRAAVTAMGFGGINTHLVLEEADVRPRGPLDERTATVARSVQDLELLLVDAASPEELRERLTRLIEFVPVLSYAQLGDLAVTAEGELRDLPYRAAVIVSSPEDAERRLSEVAAALDAGQTTLFAADSRSFLGWVDGPGRVGFLFPGQGSGSGTNGGALSRWSATVADMYATASLPTEGDMVATAVAQPRIVTGSMAGLRAMAALGVEASAAVGHSLGEISALHWAGALSEETLLRVASLRGQVMTEHSDSGTMASVGASPDKVTALAADLPIVIAGYNGPASTVIAGPVAAIEAFGEKAAQEDMTYTRLPVSHAFHSPLVAAAADAFGDQLGSDGFGPIERQVISTITGAALAPDTDIPALLRQQITAPVLFAQAAELAAKDVNLFVEVGPGQVLSGMLAAVTDVPAVALDTDSQSLGGLLGVVGAAFAAGVPVLRKVLFQDRFTRPLEIGAQFSFFASPCEQAPQVQVTGTGGPAAAETAETAETAEPAETDESAETTSVMLRTLAAARAELPVSLVLDTSRLLDDLHLSSITVGQIMNKAAESMGIEAPQSLSNVAMASVQELADALDSQKETGQDSDSGVAPTVDGAAGWARSFVIDFEELPRPARLATEADGSWQLYTVGGQPLADQLHEALEHAGIGDGVLVYLPPDCTQEQLEPALLGAQEATRREPGTRFVLVQHGRGAAGLAKTLHLESPHLRVTIAHVPQTAMAVDWVVAEVAATEDFADAYYDDGGVRRVPVLRALPVRPARVEQPLDASDVLLVTGGGKGITAECALAVVLDSGARLAVMGRSDPAEDPELAANLKRMADSGVTARYVRADVTDPEAVRSAIAEIAEALGPVTALLHGAGRNEPDALINLDMDAFRRTFAPKVDGLRVVLDAIDPGRLRLLVTFGSIIGRAGLRGEAHYATVNEWLADLTEEVAGKYPDCRCLCTEWSVWSGVGMGERLEVVEALSRDGITPITPDQGVPIMRRLITDCDVPTVVQISGRTGSIDTIRHQLPPLPLLRFVDKPLVRYHGVELVTEAELSVGTDLYLADHLLDGNLLFPAVFGLEAMAQVAQAVSGEDGLPVIEQAEFLRPIVIPPDGSTTIRIAAVVTDDHTVEVTIRSAETGFAAEHFRARLRFTGQTAAAGPPDQIADGLPLAPLDPASDLYGDILFQGPRFQRLRRYHQAAARNVDADVSATDATDWFAGFLPTTLLLGDPGMRDALMHGTQVCIPDATLLPVGIEKVYPGGAALAAAGELRFCANERSHDGDTYVYDIAVRTGAGAVVERWEGLRLRAVRQADGRGPWVAPLLGPYIERTLERVIGGPPVAVVVEPYEADGVDRAGQRRARTAAAAGRVLGHEVEIRYRQDGRPEIDGDSRISASHGPGVTLCVASTGTLGCDIESVVTRSRTEWDDLLGSHAPLAALTAGELGESLDIACTRVWTGIECLQKVGLPPLVPLTLMPGAQSPWTVFTSGPLRIATLITTLRDDKVPVVFAILAEGPVG